MQRIYRGVSYDSPDIAVDLVENGLTGTYRGATVQFRSLRTPIIPQSAVVMRYRGIEHLGWK